MQKTLRMGKRGQVFDQLANLGIGIASLVIIFAVVFLIAANVGDNAAVAADPNATAAVNTLTVAASTIPGWVPLVVIAVIGSILISLVALFRSTR